MTGIPCRRCGEITAEMTKLRKPARDGSLMPYAAECKERCSKGPATRTGRPAKPRPAVITAYRPGKCGACTRDIVPGDKITFIGDVHFVHYEVRPG